MNEQFLEHYLEHKRKIAVIIIVLSLLVITSFMILHNYSNNLITHNKQLAYAITNVKYLTANAQLLIERYTHNDKGGFSKVEYDINESLNEVNIILNGGTFLGFEFMSSYNDATTMDLASKIKDEIVFIKNKFEKFDPAEVKEYDNLFTILEKHLTELDDYQIGKFTKIYEKYNKVQIVAYSFIAILIIMSLIMIRNFNQELEEKTFLVYLDKLTNIQNTKGYQYEIDQLLYLFERYETPFSIIMFDIDNFSEVNNKYGNKIGNLVLADIANLISKSIKESSDMIFRVGGEEFIMLCPNISLDAAIIVANNILKEIEDSLDTIDGIKLTLSAGVTQVKEYDNDDKINQRVEELMLLSKSKGKNTVSSDYDIEEDKEDDQYINEFI